VNHLFAFSAALDEPVDALLEASWPRASPHLRLRRQLCQQALIHQLVDPDSLSLP
jgi:hypothetical protein